MRYCTKLKRKAKLEEGSGFPAALPLICIKISDLHRDQAVKDCNDPPSGVLLIDVDKLQVVQQLCMPQDMIHDIIKELNPFYHGT